MLLCIWAFWWGLYALRVAYCGWALGYATSYYDCEPPFTLEQCNAFIASGLCWGIPFLIGGIYCLYNVIKWFKENKDKKQ